MNNETIGGAVAEVSAPRSNGVNGYWDASMIDVANVDYRSQEGLEKLRREYDTEYCLLAEIKDDLLEHYEGQYVIIQGRHHEVLPNVDDALRRACKIFPKGLFFLGRINPSAMKAYLAT
jgi:hypothetical protein